MDTPPHKLGLRNAWGVGLLDDLVREVHYALRRLAREPNFSVPVISTLALGIGATVAIFALVNATLIQPLPYRDAGRLVAIQHAASKVALPLNGVSPGTAFYYRANSRVFEELGVYLEEIRTLTDLSEPEQVRAAMVTPSVLAVLGPAVSVGNPPAPRDFSPAMFNGVLISHSLWVRRYGADPGIVGQTIEFDRRRSLVNGVLAPGFHFPHADTDIWEAWSWPERNASRASLRSLAYGGIARLSPGISAELAERDLERLIRSFPEAFSDVTAQQLDEMGFRGVVVPLKDAVVGDTRTALLYLMATAAFLLLITWANATNLTLVRAERLSREVAVARALGAGQTHLLRRFLSESTVLAAVGGGIGLALATLAINLRFGFPPDGIPRLREVGVDILVIGLTAGLALLSDFLLGGIALVSALRPDVAGALTGAAGRSTAGRREQTARGVLVGAQVALALTLLVGSALMAQSFWRLKQVGLGFDTDGGVTFRLPIPPMAVSGNFYHGMAGIHDRIIGGLRALPGVMAAEAGSAAGFPVTPVPSFRNCRVAPAERVGESGAAWPYALCSFATPGYFRTMGIPLLKGRAFRYDDTGRDAHGVIMSASLAAALFGDDDPIGRRIRLASGSKYPDYAVAGVAGDVPSETIREGPSKVLYFPNLYPPKADTITGVVHIFIPNDEIYIVRTKLPVTSVLPAIRRIVREVDPKLMVTRVATLEQLVADDMVQTRLTMLLLLVASGTALVLALVGIYGVLSYAVSQRMPELGLRIALGQSPAGVVRMVMRQGAYLALTGIATGLLAAFALTRYLRTLLYQVSPNDPAAFVAMAGLLFAVALAASYLPAQRAARIDPVRALRGE